jgi:hypothetical protein
MMSASCSMAPGSSMWIGAEVRRELRRLAHQGLVARLAGLEPGPVVVGGEFVEEIEGGFAEHGEPPGATRSCAA